MIEENVQRSGSCRFGLFGLTGLGILAFTAIPQFIKEPVSDQSSSLTRIRQDELANANLFALLNKEAKMTVAVEKGSRNERERALRRRPSPTIGEDGQDPTPTPPAGDYTELAKLISDRKCIVTESNPRDNCMVGRSSYTPVYFYTSGGFDFDFDSLGFCCNPNNLDLSRIQQNCAQPENDSQSCPSDIGLLLIADDALWCCSPQSQGGDRGA